jgi:hypothetical protein
VDFVAPGGRLAQVLPAELIHAQYADQVLAHVCDNFERVAVAMFDEAVFPGAQEEVVLLFAEGKGEGPAAGVEVLSFHDVAELTIPHQRSRTLGLDTDHKLLASLIEEESLLTYDQLRQGEQTYLLGELGSVDIGAVTGANDFFLLAADAAAELPSELLRPAISKAVHVAGACLVDRDLLEMAARGIRTQMLVVDPVSPHAEHEAVRAHLEAGVRAGVHERYKCRIRDPWWSLPASQLRTPPLFLTYMAAEFPRLVVNEANAMSTNNVHGVTLRNGTDPRALAASFYNSLTLLSVELVGRSYGGGVLKLEPTEAERLVLPRVTAAHSDLLPDVDELVRLRSYDALVSKVDKAVLVDGLGLSPATVAKLRRAAALLRDRRRARAGRPALAL